MLSLNNDCLNLIFRLLTLREQVILTNVCVRFRDVIVAYIWSKKYQEIYTNGEPPENSSKKLKRSVAEVAELNKSVYQDFFLLNYNHVVKLEISNVTRRAFSSFLGRHISRPEFGFYFSFSYVRLIDLNCQDMNFHNGHMRLVAANCPVVEIFTIRSQYATGLHLNRVRHLRIFKASRCHLEASQLNDAVRDLRLLRYMDIRWNLDLEVNCLTSWGQYLKELYICEKQFLKQFVAFPLPEHFGALRVLSVICDDTDTSVAPALFAYREGWVKIFNDCGNSVKAFKIFLNSESMFDRLEHVYAVSKQPTFPFMRELHVQHRVDAERLNMLFMSKNVRRLFLYNTNYMDKALEFMHCSKRLKLIHIQTDMRGAVDKIADFILQLRNLLQEMPEHPDMTLHLKEASCLPILIFKKLEEKLGKGELETKMRLKIEVSSAECNDEVNWGRLDFHLYSNLRLAASPEDSSLVD